MRRINDMFHVDEQLRLVKTSNNEPVPDDEPVFIMRGRDCIALPVLAQYIILAGQTGTPPDRLEQLYEVMRGFLQYRATRPNTIKVPGCTHGQ